MEMVIALSKSYGLLVNSFYDLKPLYAEYWNLRKNGIELGDEFEDRIKKRGNGLIRKRFLSKKSCRDFRVIVNSVLESISAEVPILAWPMMTEQPLNAKMVVEEIKIGLRVKFVPAESLKNKVKELMEGEKGDEVRKKISRFLTLHVLIILGRSNF
ncbi:unnamed protein product [Fraxinus pennsylvanica]|uniref:UDP-glycosyltransferase n=1 Tax=Fraxinus pennsylvanica TaxID=56036 RepID=A0AAD1YYS8_9LAMI|nr:unnamed protein product [Fraxinus pennsylvanica]